MNCAHGKDTRVTANVVLRRVAIEARSTIPRPRHRVWEEIEQGDHPAWSEPPDSLRGIPSTGPLRVGTARAFLTQPLAPSGLRTAVYTEVTDIVPGSSLTTFTVVAGAEHTENADLVRHR